ncbi:hypothetical protein O3M35_002986 [Rhynocoris fuscipes]|uniref:Protein-lysine N-methyltransferase SMYD4 n=1 Tax=Rhynocoris fuscipes TaxID=488301 RepID=A0AAW1CHJ5_9HEMI
MPNQNFEKIYAEITRFLKNSGLQDTIVNNIKLNTPIQNVIESYVLLKEINLLPKPIKRTTKSDKLSAKFRNEGNIAFRQKKDMLALECYTKAVAFALIDGKELALAYANRSAVTFSLQEYIDSLEDIDRALSAYYPDKLKYKLLERKGKCLMRLNQKNEASQAFIDALEYLTKSELDSNKMNTIKKNLESLLNSNDVKSCEYLFEKADENKCEIPQLSHPASDYIQAASNAVDIHYSNVMGRHIVAATDINPGEVIAVEKPFASVLLPDMYTFFCFMCKKRCHSLLPCLHCAQVLFCSENCRTKSWEQSHCVDCFLLQTLGYIGCENMELLAVRILLLASNCGKQLIELFENEKELESFDDDREKGFINGQYLSDSYKSTHNLETNDQVRCIADLFRRSVMAALLLYSLEECTDFFIHYKRTCNESPIFYYYANELPEGGGLTVAKGYVGAYLLRYLFSVPCNAHEISEMRLKPKLDEYDSESVEIGGAIYPFLSLINHSCDPNVVRHNYNGDIVALIAIQVIKKGEQIFDNYSYHHAIHDKEQRQTHLLSQYYFVCKCPACLYDWPLYASLPENNPEYYEDVNKEEVEKSSIKFKEVLKEINIGETEGKLPFLYEHLKLLHKSIVRPWKEYNQCQEAIKQCLSVQANHYVYKTVEE